MDLDYELESIFYKKIHKNLIEAKNPKSPPETGNNFVLIFASIQIFKYYLSASIFSVLLCLVYGNRIFGPVCSNSFSMDGWKRPEMAGKGRKWLDKLFLHSLEIVNSLGVTFLHSTGMDFHTLCSNPRWRTMKKSAFF